MLNSLHLAPKLCRIDLQNTGLQAPLHEFSVKPPSIIWSDYHEQRTKKQSRRQEKTGYEPERKEGREEVQKRFQDLIKIT
jgi:hypothetical protein